MNFLVGGGDARARSGGRRRLTAGRRRARRLRGSTTYGAAGRPTGDFAGTAPHAAATAASASRASTRSSATPTTATRTPARSSRPSSRSTATTSTSRSPAATIPSRAPARPSVNLVVDGAGRAHGDGQRLRDAQLEWPGTSRTSRASGRTSRSSTEHRRLGARARRPLRALRHRGQDPLRRDGGQPARRRPGRAQHGRQGERGARLGAAGTSRDLKGKDAQIQIVDRNSGGWGHVLADQFTFADAPAQSAEQRRSWVDYGKDFYAAVTCNDVPDGRRIAIGWMNNWNYAGQIPTSPWRSAMSVPRELALRTDRRQAAARPAARRASSRSLRGRTSLHAAPPDDPARARPRCPRAARRSRSTPTLRPRHGQAGRAEGPHRQRRGDGDRLRRADGRALRRPHAVGRERLQPRLPRRPASSARRPPREGPPAHPRRLVLGRGLRRPRPTGRSPTRSSPAPTSDGVKLFADGGSGELESLNIRHAALELDARPPGPRAVGRGKDPGGRPKAARRAVAELRPTQKRATVAKRSHSAVSHRPPEGRPDSSSGRA